MVVPLSAVSLTLDMSRREDTEPPSVSHSTYTKTQYASKLASACFSIKVREVDFDYFIISRIIVRCF